MKTATRLKTTAIAKLPEKGAIVQSEATSLLEAITKASANPKVDIEKLKALLDMQERIMTKNAEAAFNEAMRDCQSEMKAIIADADNPQTKSKYASYHRLDKELRPIYTRHGFSISFNTAPLDKEAVRVLALVSRGMFTREYQTDIPADGKGAKGGDVMTKTHAVGSAMSYGARYLLKFIFNVAISEEDDDGNSASKSQVEPDPEGRKKLEDCGSLSALQRIWGDLKPEQRKTLVGVKNDCKERIIEAEKQATL